MLNEILFNVLKFITGYARKKQKSLAAGNEEGNENQSRMQELRLCCSGGKDWKTVVWGPDTEPWAEKEWDWDSSSEMY